MKLLAGSLYNPLCETMRQETTGRQAVTKMTITATSADTNPEVVPVHTMKARGVWGYASTHS